MPPSKNRTLAVDFIGERTALLPPTSGDRLGRRVNHLKFAARIALTCPTPATPHRMMGYAGVV